MPVTVWVATSNIYLGSGGSHVLAYTPGQVVPDEVVLRYSLSTNGLVATATINDDGSSPDWAGTDPVTHRELEQILAGLGEGSAVVRTVNGESGTVVLDAADIAETAARVYVTPAQRTTLAGATAAATPSTLVQRDADGHFSVTRVTLTGESPADPTDAAPKGYVDAEAADAKTRATHTGTQPAASISDLREAVEDIVAAFLAAGSNVTLTHADNGEGAGSLTIAASGTGGTGGVADPEAVRDIVGATLVGSGLVTVTVNDAGDLITVSTTATANASDAALRDRTTHSGTQPAATISDLTEAVQDIIGSSVVAGTNVSVTYDDATGQHVIASTAVAALPQRTWNPTTSTWSARPNVPVGTVVTAHSDLYPAATPPPNAQVGDIWSVHESSVYAA